MPLTKEQASEIQWMISQQKAFLDHSEKMLHRVTKELTDRPASQRFEQTLALSRTLRCITDIALNTSATINTLSHLLSDPIITEVQEDELPKPQNKG